MLLNCLSTDDGKRCNRKQILELTHVGCLEAKWGINASAVHVFHRAGSFYVFMAGFTRADRQS